MEKIIDLSKKKIEEIIEKFGYKEHCRVATPEEYDMHQKKRDLQIFASINGEGEDWNDFFS